MEATIGLEKSGWPPALRTGKRRTGSSMRARGTGPSQVAWRIYGEGYDEGMEHYGTEDEQAAAYARAQQAQMDALMKARRAQMAPDDPQLQAQARAAREAAIAAQEAAGPADWQAAYRQQHEGQGDGTQPGGQVPSLHQSWDEGGEGYDEGMEHYGTEDEQAVSYGGETLTADDVEKRKQSLRGKYYRSRAQYKSAVIKLLHEYLGGSSEQFSSTRDKMNVFRERMNDLRESAAAKMKQVLEEAESLRPELRSWNPEQITQLQEEIQSKIVKALKNAEASAQQQFREVREAREGQMDQTAGMAEEEAQQSHYEMQDQGEAASGAQGDEASASADAFQQQQMQLQQQLATALTHHHQQQEAAQMAQQQGAQYAAQLAQYQDQLRELQQMQAASQRDMLQAQLRGDAPGYMTAQRNLQSLQQRVLATTHQVQQAGAQAAAAQQQAQAAAAAAAAAQQQAQQLQQQVQQHQQQQQQQQQQQTQYVSQADINPHLQEAYGGIQQEASQQQGQQQAGAQDQTYQMQQQQQQQAMAQAQQQGQDPRWAQQQQYWQQQGGDANAQQASQQQQQMQQQMANQQQGASSEDATRDHWAAQWSQIYGQQNPQAKALKGGVFALTGTVSIPRKQLRKMVIADGGKVEENVTERTTHLITKAGFSSQKVVDAFKYGIPAVSVEYIEMCIKQGELLDVRKPEIKSLLLKINPQPNGTPIVKMEEDGSGQFTASVGAQASAGLPLRGGVFAISGDLSIPTTRLAEIIRFNGGQVVEDAEEDAVTHVVTTPTNLLDLPTKVFGALNKSVALVTEDYIQASIEHGKLLDLDNKENHTFLVLNVHDQDTSETASIKEPVPTSERRQIQAATVNRQLMDISIRKMQKLGLTISETPEKQLQISKILAEASLEVKTKMQVGDILHKINGSKVTSLPEVGDILSKIQLGLAMQLQVERLPDADQKHSLEQGDSFGELAIMYNDPRAATCKAATDCKLWALDRVSFKSELNAQKESEKAHTDDDAAQVSDLLTDDRNVPQSIGLPQKRKRTVQVYFCTKCNKDTAEAFKFCPDCGSKLVTKVKSGHAIRSDKSFNKNADVIIL